MQALSRYLQDSTTTIVREFYGEQTRVLTGAERDLLLARLNDDHRPKWETVDGVEYRNDSHDRLVVVSEGH